MSCKFFLCVERQYVALNMRRGGVRCVAGNKQTKTAELWARREHRVALEPVQVGDGTVTEVN